jgi:hypothetical protein
LSRERLDEQTLRATQRTDARCDATNRGGDGDFLDAFERLWYHVNNCGSDASVGLVGVIYITDIQVYRRGSVESDLDSIQASTGLYSPRQLPYYTTFNNSYRCNCDFTSVHSVFFGVALNYKCYHGILWVTTRPLSTKKFAIPNPLIGG